MKSPYDKIPRSYTYGAITQHCFEQMCQLMTEAAHKKGHEARCRRERAYGIYMGWRALVAEHTDPALFYSDDRRLEAALNSDERWQN